MAFRTWGRLLLTAFGVSVLAGAGQLGIAYGFGIVRLTGTFTDGSVNRWPAQLVWVGWFAAVAAVAGAVLTARLARRLGLPGSTGEQLAVAGAAALGATVVAPLCMQPARAAQLGTVDPVWAVGICAILGAVVGAGAALAVLLSPPLGWNIALTAGAVWLLALISVAPSLATTGPLPTVRLGVLEPSWLDTGTAQRIAMLILPAVALIAGAVVGALARWRGHAPVVGGAAGAAGPVLVAFAYLTAGPGDAADRYQLAPYYGALIAVAAGALGSAAVTALRRSTAAPTTNAIEPTDILQPLPAGPTRATGASGSTDRTGSGLAVTGPGAAGTPTAAGSASTTPNLFPTDRGTGPSGDGRPSPAHWDWPEAAQNGTPAPVPTGSARPLGGRHLDHQFPGIPVSLSDDPGAARSAAFGSAAASGSAVVEESATGADRATDPDRRSSGGARKPGMPTDADVAASQLGPVVDPLVSSLPAPTLPSGRRISAIDVLAAGRTPTPPAPETPVAPEARTPTTPTSETPVPPEARTPTTPTSETPVPPPAVPESGPASAAAPPVRPKRPRRPRATAPAPAEPTVPAPAAGAPADPARTARSAAPTPATTEVSSPSAANQRGAADRLTVAAAGATLPMDAPTATMPDQPDREPAPGTGDRATARPRSTRRAAPTRRGTTAAGPEPTPADAASSAADTPPAPAAATARPTTNPPKPAPEPTGSAPSPRPRYSIFDDGTDEPGDVRPAWPVTPAPTRPTRPRPAARPVDPSTGDTAAPVDPAPRPRHLALPDLGRPPARDPLADSGELATPASDVMGPVWARHATDTRGERTGARHADDPSDQNPAGDGEGDESPTGKSRARRGLFRRNRGRGDEDAATDRNDHESEPVPAHDEEYVDWVTGLGRPAETDPEGLRTGRHHRD